MLVSSLLTSISSIVALVFVLQVLRVHLHLLHLFSVFDHLFGYFFGPFQIFLLLLQLFYVHFTNAKLPVDRYLPSNATKNHLPQPSVTMQGGPKNDQKRLLQRLFAWYKPQNGPFFFALTKGKISLYHVNYLFNSLLEPF